jgi:hypothetical protein
MNTFRESLEKDDRDGKLLIDPTHEQKMYIIETIKTLSPENQQLFYTIMKTYNCAYDGNGGNKGDTDKMIYGGKQLTQTKYAFNIMLLPIRLRNILLKFCQIIRNHN